MKETLLSSVNPFDEDIEILKFLSYRHISAICNSNRLVTLCSVYRYQVKVFRI